MANIDPTISLATEPIIIRPKPKRDLLIKLLTLAFSAIAAVASIEINNRLKKLDNDINRSKLNVDSNLDRTSAPAQEEFMGKI